MDFQKFFNFALDSTEYFWYGTVKAKCVIGRILMMIKFPEKEDNFSVPDAHTAYKYLVDSHLHFLKQQSNCELLYWKLMGIFFLSIMGALILKRQGIIMDSSIFITIIGFGCLSIFIQKIKMDLEYAVSATSCVDRGILIEDNYNYLGRLFRIFQDNKILVYRNNLLSRALPFIFIGLGTLSAGAILANKVGTWLAVTMALLFIVGLSVFAGFYMRVAKKVIFGIER